MDNFNPLNPDEIKSEVNQNIPISPEIPIPTPNLSTASPSPNPIENITRPVEQVNLPPTLPSSQPQSNISDINRKIEDQLTSYQPGKIRIKNLIIGIIVGLVLVGIIGVGVYYFVFLKNGAKVNISANQPGINLNIDGNDYSNINSPFQIKLTKGSHKVTATKDGFASMTKTLEVTSTVQTYTISFDLVAFPTATKIIAKPVLFPAYSKDLKSLLYLEKGDSSYSLKEFNLATQTEVNQIDTIGEVTKVAWSPTYRQAAIKVINSAQSQDFTIPYLNQYPEGTKINWIINLERQELVNITKKDLHPSIKNITFNQNGDKIAYFFQNENSKLLGVANYDGSNYERLMEFKTIEFEPDVIWSPDGNRIAIFANQENDIASSAKNPNIYTYNFDTRNVIQVSKDGVSYGALFSPDGSKLAYISGNVVKIYDFSIGNSIETELTASLTNCSWLDNQTIIIANTDKSIMKLSLNGKQVTKDEIGYQKEGIGIIQSIFSDTASLYLFTNDGVYELKLAGNV